VEPIEMFWWIVFIVGGPVLLYLGLKLLLQPANTEKKRETLPPFLDEHGKWTPQEYERRLQAFEKDKQWYMSHHKAVKGEHPDFNKRSPNYIDASATAKGDFWRELNIDYYKTFPELAEEHGWDMERMQYKNRK